MSKETKLEGKDIMYYIDHPTELKKLMDGIIDDELTTGRIRTIYVRMNYGNASATDLAKYYDIPVKVVKDIANGRLFGFITGKSYDIEED